MHASQRFARNVSKPIKIAFDEYGVWDETVGEYGSDPQTRLCLPSVYRHPAKRT